MAHRIINRREWEEFYNTLPPDDDRAFTEEAMVERFLDTIGASNCDTINLDFMERVLRSLEEAYNYNEKARIRIEKEEESGRQVEI